MSSRLSRRAKKFLKIWKLKTVDFVELQKQSSTLLGLSRSYKYFLRMKLPQNVQYTHGCWRAHNGILSTSSINFRFIAWIWWCGSCWNVKSFRAWRSPLKYIRVSAYRLQTLQQLLMYLTWIPPVDDADDNNLYKYMEIIRLLFNWIINHIFTLARSE